MTYGPKEAVVADLYHDRLTVAVALLEDRREDLVYLANAQIRAIEEVASAAGYLGANLARAAGERGDGAGEGAAIARVSVSSLRSMTHSGFGWPASMRTAGWMRREKPGASRLEALRSASLMS